MWIGESGHAVNDATSIIPEKSQASTETVVDIGSSRWEIVLTELSQQPARGLVFGMELGVSRRGMPMIYLLIAAFLAAACWLRPALSPDIRSVHIPLGIWQTANPAPEEILAGPRRFVPDSVGVFLLVIVAVSAVMVWRRPQRLGVAAGVLLCAALAANAAVALNHPVLIGLLDQEYEQRRQVAHLIGKAPEKKAMANSHNGRIGGHGALVADEQRGDVVRGWVYLLYGQWLVLWAAVGIFYASSGPVLRRARDVFAWGLLGMLLAGGFCCRRLYAEYYWLEACDREGQGDVAAAHAALERAVEVFPEFEQLERTWLLGGKLDYQAGRQTASVRFFQAYQIERDKGLPRAVAFGEDLPWLIKRTSDYRTGLTTSPAGFYLAEKPDSSETGTLYSHEQLAALKGPLVTEYLLAIAREPVHAIAIMEDLLHKTGVEEPAVRSQAARFWTNRGLQLYLDRPILSDSEFSYFTHDRRLMAALDAWAQAAELVPGKRDCAYYQATALARIDRQRPDRVESAFEPMRTDLADRAIQGEIFDLLGDAYWEAGLIAEARRLYAASYDVFSLPKRPNIRAQKKLGGL
jgi:hypothetical protein